MDSFAFGHSVELSVPIPFRLAVFVRFDVSTRFGFPGSLDNTQTFSFRPHLSCTPNSNLLLPQSLSTNWSRDRYETISRFSCLRLNTKTGNRLSHHLSRSVLRAVPVLAVMGTFSLEGVSVVPLRSHVKTLPHGDTLVEIALANCICLGFRNCNLFPVLLDECSCRHLLALIDVAVHPRHGGRTKRPRFILTASPQTFLILPRLVFWKNSDFLRNLFNGWLVKYN